jgi:hypothetical protein
MNRLALVDGSLTIDPTAAAPAMGPQSADPMLFLSGW